MSFPTELGTVPTYLSFFYFAERFGQQTRPRVVHPEIYNYFINTHCLECKSTSIEIELDKKRNLTYFRLGQDARGSDQFESRPLNTLMLTASQSSPSSFVPLSVSRYIGCFFNTL